MIMMLYGCFENSVTADYLKSEEFVVDVGVLGIKASTIFFILVLKALSRDLRTELDCPMTYM